MDNWPPATPQQQQHDLKLAPVVVDTKYQSYQQQQHRNISANIIAGPVTQRCKAHPDANARLAFNERECGGSVPIAVTHC